MQIAKDLWRCLIVESPIETVIARGTIEGLPCHWLPAPPGLRYLADPFGYWRDNCLHIFVEAFDYRNAVGTIALLRYDDRFRLIDQQPVLREPWHLSYPIVFDADGATWMLPEAHRSGRLTLYRAVAFPTRWVPECTITLDHVAIDATPTFHNGLWWLFYSSADRPQDHMRTLHAAWAERITGPWTPHPANPIRTDLSGARPGGSAVCIGDRLVLPTQDCTRTYGGAVQLLDIERLDRQHAHVTPGARLTAPAALAPFTAGLHTLSAAGPVTLIDVKRTNISLAGLAMRPLRMIDAWRDAGSAGEQAQR